MEVVPGGVCAAVGWACATKRAATIRAAAAASNPPRLLNFISVTCQIDLGIASCTSRTETDRCSFRPAIDVRRSVEPEFVERYRKLWHQRRDQSCTGRKLIGEGIDISSGLPMHRGYAGGRVDHPIFPHTV